MESLAGQLTAIDSGRVGVVTRPTLKMVLPHGPSKVPPIEYLSVPADIWALVGVILQVPCVLPWGDYKWPLRQSV